ncbi:MAG: SCP2 sterol-binding domain-containing protein [Oscillospiraceae bacterium]|nr:SCP2 sterol-binding domain-containing protein [Oscillospiraceae bacterium]
MATNMTSQIDNSRTRASAFLRSMEVEPGIFTNSTYNKPVHTPGMRLPATYNAVSCLRLMGEELPDTAATAAFLNSFQIDSGAYRIPEMKAEELYYPDFEYDDFHITNYVLSALEETHKPQKEFRFLSDYDTSEKLTEWLVRRDMARPWTEGNYIVNLASFYEYTDRHDLFTELYQWHLDNQDEFGYWHDPTTNDLTSAMAGAAHNFHLFYKLNEPVPRYRKIIDHCLSIPNEISSACIDVDIADILAHFMAYGYRTEEIKTYLTKKLNDLLHIQQEDGGFYDVTSGIRLFDGWSGYQEPQGLSNCFATWFRMIAIGFCAEVLYPGEFTWKFRQGIGIGYCNPNYLSGGFKEPTERPARQYAETEENTVGQTKAGQKTTGQSTTGKTSAGQNHEKEIECSPELLLVMDEVRERFSHVQTDFVAVFEVSGEGVFTLDLQNGSATPTDREVSDLRVTLSMKTLKGILSGKTNPTAAYALRKLKLKGDMGKALKLVGVLGS